MCLVGFLAFAAKLRFDSALRASGDYMASHDVLGKNVQIAQLCVFDLERKVSSYFKLNG